MTRLQQAARAVAEGISALNQLTLGPRDELESPSDVADVVAGLSLAMSLMPQLLGQLATFLEVEHVKEVLAGGQKAGTREQVRAVSDALHRAGLDAEAMAAALDTAHGACAQLQASGPKRLGHGEAGVAAPEAGVTPLTSGVTAVVIRPIASLA